MYRKEQKVLFDVGKRISDLLKGKIPERIEISDYTDEIEKRFIEIINQLIESYSESHRFIVPLSQGELHSFVPKRSNFFSSPFKELHARLLHLTWQTERIAEGDYTQRVDFMGDFSTAFNSMVAKLAEREQELKDANDRLEARVRERTEELTREITERKRAEEALKEINKKLSNLNQQLYELIFVASHDLKEPVRHVSLFGQLLNKALSEKLDGDEKENLNFMIEGADRIRQLVESLLAYSQVLNKNVVSKNVDLNIVIEKLKKSELSSCIKETHGKLLIPDALPVVQCDLSQIRTLLHNLIKNAFKYHRIGILPVVTIRASSKVDDYIRIEVEDNGIGIKPDLCKNIFAMFRRLHNRHEYEGTGIGLALCKRIVEKHRGEIGVDSTYGQGSIFWFTLPAQKNPQNEQTGGTIMSVKKQLKQTSK
jgi:signal transduction histidine kinase